MASGQSVEAGQLLAIVESDELNQQHANLLLRLDASRLRSRGYRHRHEMAALESEHEEWLALETQRQQLAEQLAGLELRASRSGRVVTRHVDELVGQYVGEGEELLAIGDESQKCIECLVRQDDLERFRRASGSQVSVYFSAGGKMRCELGPIQPRGSRVPSASAFFVPFGGPLSARQAERTGEVAGESRSTWELLTPHFSGVVELDPTSSRQVRSGQRATVALDGERDSIGGILTRRLHAFLRGATHDGGS